MARIIAITACPTGIAHTFIAAEKLEQAGKELNHDIKVETQGSGGAKNVLTGNDIRSADGIIIAADVKVDLSRFKGRKVYKTSTKATLKDAKELIEKALNGEGSLVKDTTSEPEAKGIYKHLMSGVSHMLPFVIAGGILIALAFLVDIRNSGADNFGSGNDMAAALMGLGGAAFSFMIPVMAGYIAYSIAGKPGLMVGFGAGFLANNPDTFERLYENFGLNNTAASGFLGALVGGFIAGYLVWWLTTRLFKDVPNSLRGIVNVLVVPLIGLILIGLTMLILNVPMGAINSGLSDWLSSLSGVNAAILGLLVGGMMAVDMGGPINKTAYVFGVGTLASATAGEGTVAMAAVMAGGMVPPLAIALHTTVFKSRWTKQEKDAGITNWVMGASFITEGAIPFAAARPKIIIPSIIVGSALAGFLTGLFGVASPAPHGGVLVIALTSSIIPYLIAIILGTIAGAAMIEGMFRITKKK